MLPSRKKSRKVLNTQICYLLGWTFWVLNSFFVLFEINKIPCKKEKLQKYTKMEIHKNGDRLLFSVYFTSYLIWKKGCQIRNYTNMLTLSDINVTFQTCVWKYVL